MSPLFRDPHPMCAQCRGRKCSIAHPPHRFCFFGSWAPFAFSATFHSEVAGELGGVSRAGTRGTSSPHLALGLERVGGFLGSQGECFLAAPSLSKGGGGGVAEPSRSQELTVLVCSAPSLVAFLQGWGLF